MTKTCIGIRREDKNEWERRAPLTPHDVGALIKNEGLGFIVQPSPIRVFKEHEYIDAGAKAQEDLSKCGLVFAIKELPLHFIMPDKTYVFFSHTIKGQEHNMPMLKRIIESRSTLIDYERIVDEHNRRLIFFGEHAGLAGMIDTLWAFGQRLEWEKIKNPFADIVQAYRYEDLDAAEEAISNVGEKIETKGIDSQLAPLVIGIAGYGNVSRGAQKILTYLPVTEIAPDELETLFDKKKKANRKTLYKVVFHEGHTVEPVSELSKFDLHDFYAHPENYKSKFANYLPFISVLVNCIYWDKKYPRLVTKAELKDLFERERHPRLRVVGDISCDIDGGIEFTVKATNPADPVFVFDPLTGRVTDGVAGIGPVVLAVDNLPCELPKESSNDFSHVLKRFVPSIAMADFEADFGKLELPSEIKKAVIVYRGKLTPDYAYLEKFLKDH
jgi:saccharopine dehydrogenase (NAD+, L-lysine-forming)